MNELKNKIYYKKDEMRYRFVKVVDKGIKDGYYWFILSLGTHPCAYVGLNKNHKYYGKSYKDINIDCHYGLTFCDKDFLFNPIVTEDLWWIGWDYAHCNDYASYYDEDDDFIHSKRWTVEEIRNEVMNVIEQLKEAKE